MICDAEKIISLAGSVPTLRVVASFLHGFVIFLHELQQLFTVAAILARMEWGLLSNDLIVLYELFKVIKDLN